MKNDTTTTLLNFVLAITVILGVIFGYFTIMRTHQLRTLQTEAAIAGKAIIQAQGLANETAVFNKTAKSPELTRILESVQPKANESKPAAR